jgi:hypothetical protein
MDRPTPFQTGLKYGLITSLLGIIASLILYSTGSGDPTGSSLQFGVSIIIYVTGLYLGFDAFKRGNEGFASLGELVKVAIFIGLITGGISGVFTYIYMQYIDSDIMTKIFDQQRLVLEDKGLSDKEIDQALEMAKSFMSPKFLIPIQIITSVITLTILGLIVGAIMKKNRPAF